MWFIELIFILLLLIIIYQDFRYRSISVWTLPVLLLAVLFINSNVVILKDLLINTAANLLIFSLEMALVIAYFSIKNKRLTPVLNTLIGTGDIIYIAILCVLFSPIVFNVFMFLGLCLTIVGYAISRLLLLKINTIPLAGSLSVILVLSWTLKMIFHIEQLYTIVFLEKVFMF